jgi:hypothetical protein
MTNVKICLIAAGQTLLRLVVRVGFSLAQTQNKSRRFFLFHSFFWFSGVFFLLSGRFLIDSTPATTKHWTASSFNEYLSPWVKNGTPER